MKQLTTILLVALACLCAAGETRGETLVVRNSNDVSYGFCGGLCTLRDAIAAAAPGDTVKFDSGVFFAPRTIRLKNGELVIDKTITIAGEGKVIIEGNRASRIFRITPGATVALSGMTIKGGKDDDRGGGISNEGALTLTNMVITDNKAQAQGGGIYTNGALNLINSTLSDNTAEPDIFTSSSSVQGGGIANHGVLHITDSVIAGNYARGDGGGIASFGVGSVTITNTAVTGNTASALEIARGGGIYYPPSGRTAGINITNSTISGNTAGADGDSKGGAGAGIWLGKGMLTNVTIAFNYVLNIGSGGGAFLDKGAVIGNSIIAGNYAPTAAPDIYGAFTSSGNNLVQSRAGSEGYIASDLPDATDPRLAPLSDNGGASATHALLATSPAIDAGSSANAGHETDGRGAGFPRRIGNSVDIGAYERSGVLAPTADTWVQGAENFFDTNYGTSAEIQLKRTFNTRAGRGRRGFMRFDTASVSGAITSAKLRVFARLTDAGLSPTEMIIQKVIDNSWDELAVTWNNQPAVESPAALASIKVSGANGQYYEFDLTAFLQVERAAGRLVVSFRLINGAPTGNGGASYTSINSKEAASNQPQLIIEQ
jgi:hypothetical protein